MIKYDKIFGFFVVLNDDMGHNYRIKIIKYVLFDEYHKKMTLEFISLIIIVIIIVIYYCI
jgi:hypothetical protein